MANARLLGSNSGIVYRVCADHRPMVAVAKEHRTQQNGFTAATGSSADPIAIILTRSQ